MEVNTLHKKSLLAQNEHDLLLDSVDEACKSESNTFVEVGLMFCGTTIALVEKLKTKQKDYCVIGVDDSNRSESNWQGLIQPALTNQVTGVLHKELSWEAARHVEDESLAWCFIDADHRYESVNKDIGAWYKKVAVNGILAFHDTGINFNLLRQARRRRPKQRIGVLKAILEWKLKLRAWGFEGFSDIQVGFGDKSATGMLIFKRQ